MTLSLKTQNQPLLATLLLWNFAVLYMVLAAKSHDWTQIVAIGTHWHQTLMPAGIAVIAVGILNDQFDPEWKARIVFWKWRDPLPAAGAFTEIGPSDPRIDMADLEQRCGPFPKDPAGQNRAWFKLFKSVETAPTILAPHKRYLLYRDYACLSLLFLLTVPPLAYWQSIPMMTLVMLIAILGTQFILARNAARIASRRLVATVLASC